MTIRTNFRSATPFDAEAVKRRAWRDQGILVVDVDRAPNLTWDQREALRAAAVRLYGAPDAQKEKAPTR